VTLRLVSIGPSHYCEKARWALDHAGLPFVEEVHLPLAHWAAAVPRGSRTVPLLLRAASSPLRDSTDIVDFADEHAPAGRKLFPSDPALRSRAKEIEHDLDETLGPLTRRLAYCFLVPRPELFVRTFERSAPLTSRLALKALHPLLRGALKRAFRTSERAESRLLVALAKKLDELARLLDGRRYLVGDTFSAADLTLASLATPVLMPDGFGVASLSRRDLPDDLGEIVDGLRRTPVGEHVLRMYREHRAPR
jgi:glutathione S-transferase